MRTALLTALVGSLAHLMSWLWASGQAELFWSVLLALAGGELAALARRGKTLSALFSEAWARDPRRGWLSLSLFALLNLFGLHLQGVF